MLRGVHLLIERGKEQVLKNRFVVGAFPRIEIVENIIEIVWVKERVRHQSFFPDEPDKNEPREQADHAGGVADFDIFPRVVWERDLIDRPEIPVGEFVEEAFVEFFGV